MVNKKNFLGSKSETKIALLYGYPFLLYILGKHLGTLGQHLGILLIKKKVKKGKNGVGLNCSKNIQNTFCTKKF